MYILLIKYHLLVKIFLELLMNHKFYQWWIKFLISKYFWLVGVDCVGGSQYIIYILLTLSSFRFECFLSKDFNWIEPETAPGDSLKTMFFKASLCLIKYFYNVHMIHVHSTSSILHYFTFTLIKIKKQSKEAMLSGNFLKRFWFRQTFYHFLQNTFMKRSF